MTQPHRFEDEWAIRRTLERYCRAVDDNEFRSVAELFTDDAILEFGGQLLDGHEQIRGYFDAVHGAGRAPVTGVHLLGNCIVDFDGDAATVSTDFVHVWRVGSGDGIDASAILAGEHLGQIPIAGRYIDRMRRVDGDWLIAARGAELYATSPRVAGHAGPGPSTADHIRMRTTVKVREGRVEEFEKLLSLAASDSVAEVANRSNGVLGYSAHFDSETRVAVLYEHHRDLPALYAHLAVGPERRAALRELCDPHGPTEIFGAPPAELLTTLSKLGVDVRVFPAVLCVQGDL